MKIFGHYIFEDSPELKAYKRDKKSHEKREWADRCIHDGKNTRHPWPAIPSMPFSDISVAVGYIDEDKEWLKIHKEYAERGECHKFNGKKYCYHTGEEIVTDL